MSPRKPPLPLRSPDGVIRAYACAYCHRVGMRSDVSAPRGARQAEARSSHRDASRCCTCLDCGTHHLRSATGWAMTCPACVAKREAADAAKPRGEMVACADCGGMGRLSTRTLDGREVMADCPECEGDGLVWRASCDAP